jgi:glycosyltransferase involved in cell wall biosynthesis
VKVFPHNFNPNSNSGPNKFTRQLFRNIVKNFSITMTGNQSDADVEFCLIQQQAHKVKPMLLRLDGIYFNSEQDYDTQNKPIKYAYDNADLVIFQSEFNKNLTEHWFGKHRNSKVIHNAPDLDLIKNVNPVYWDKKYPKDTELWSCASSWRPHKRLKENIKYFKEFAPRDAIMAIAGSGAIQEDIDTGDGRVFYLGDLDYISLLSLYRRSSTFVHLAYMDHCPNVVVDAQAAGCKIICSSTGGTSEIVSNGNIVFEKEWDYSPIKLYEPPPINFDNIITVSNKSSSNIEECSKKYYLEMSSLLK